jgi:hypothetical protein
MEPQPELAPDPVGAEPAADETARYKVIKSEGATLYNVPQNKELSKFKQGVFRGVTLPVDTIFTGSQPNTDVNGWVEITEGPYRGKYLKSKKQDGERVITPLIDFDISNLESHAELISTWHKFGPAVGMVGGFETFTKKVEEYNKVALALRESDKRKALQSLKLKNQLEQRFPMFTDQRNIKLFNLILTFKSKIIDLGDEWLRINTEHTVRLDCDETEIRDCLEKCKLSAGNFSPGIVDFLDIYLSLKDPSTAAALGGGKRKRKRKSKRRKTQKRKKKSKSIKTHKRKSKKKRRKKTKRR